MHTRQKDVLLIFLNFPGKEFLRITNFHIWQLYFSKGKTAIFQTQDFYNVLILEKVLEKIQHCHETYLGESSEADIQPSLYNQALSTILQASQIF